MDAAVELEAPAPSSRWSRPAASPAPASASTARSRPSASRSSGWRGRRPGALAPRRQGRAPHRGRRAAAVLCAAAAHACGGGARPYARARQRAARSGSASPRILRPYRLAKLLGDFALASGSANRRARRPEQRTSSRDLERGELDLALFKREAGAKGAIAVWPERVHWVTIRKSHLGRRRRLGAADRRSAASIAPAPSTRWKAPAAPGTCPTRHRASPASRPRSPPAWGLGILSEMSIQADHRVHGQGRLCADQPRPKWR